MHLEDKIAQFSGWALLKVNVSFCLLQQLFAQAWGGRFDQSSWVQTTSVPRHLLSWYSTFGGRALQRAWQSLFPWAHPLASWALLAGGSQLGGFAMLRSGMCCPALPLPGLGTCEQPWGELAHPRLSQVCVLGRENLETKGVCSSFELWVGAYRSISCTVSPRAHPRFLQLVPLFWLSLGCPKERLLQSRALAKKSGAGSDTELAEDKPSR